MPQGPGLLARPRPRETRRNATAALATIGIIASEAVRPMFQHRGRAAVPLEPKVQNADTLEAMPEVSTRWSALTRHRLTRSMPNYDALMPWARLLRFGHSLATFPVRTSGVPFLFPCRKRLQTSSPPPFGCTSIAAPSAFQEPKRGHCPAWHRRCRYDPRDGPHLVHRKSSVGLSTLSAFEKCSISDDRHWAPPPPTLSRAIIGLTTFICDSLRTFNPTCTTEHEPARPRHCFSLSARTLESAR